MRVLICGDKSFAARGLAELLAGQNHEVVRFSRGAAAERDGRVTGPVDQIDTNPHLANPFDAVINYIMLKDESIERNIAYLDSLLRFCVKNNVPRLIHLSSISSYPSSLRTVTEDAPIESVPQRKGPYGAIKVATDLHLLAHLPASMKLTLVRPGFILGQGLLNPIVGTAFRLPWNKLLVVGNHKSHIPVISREQVNEAIASALVRSLPGPTEVLLLAAPDSPTREEFIDACCRLLGCGTGVSHFPSLMWYGLAVGGECVARAIGQGKLQPYQKLTARIGRQNFDPSKTQRHLEMDFRFDWRETLKKSLDGQSCNFDLPYIPSELSPTLARTITFLGFGRIVRQRHLPAIKRLQFAGRIRAYDLKPTEAEGVKVEAIVGARLEKSDLFIVASPGPAHTAAIENLAGVEGPVLVEKPLCYTSGELEQWRQFAADREQPVLVCHNYRFKQNVARMLNFMQQVNPGKLNHVGVHFRSPSVGNDSAAWLRNERTARTLLMDYSLHFLDLACMFGQGAWKLQSVRHEMDSHGHTGLIEGHLTANYGVNFVLRQGFGPRRARLLFDFQNYSLSLGFFPDTFVAYLSDDNPWLYKQEGRESRRATIRKIIDKLTGRDSDASHAHAFRTALQADRTNPPSNALERLTSFYNVLFELADKVYASEG